MRTADVYTVFETKTGFCAIAWNDAGITRFHLPSTSAQAARRAILRHRPNAVEMDPTPMIADVISTVKRYFEGEKIDFSGLTLDLDGQEDFSRRTYTALRRIGWGQTTTYGTLAQEIGAGPQAAREVGQAMAKNPVPLIIPCHRVLAAGGKLGGFSAPGGAGAKVRMLELEGVLLARPEPLQQTLLL